MPKRFAPLGLFTLAAALLAVPARAQSPASATATNATVTAPPAAQTADEPPDDLQLVPGEPDYVLAALPTSLRMPAQKFDLVFTHRFVRPIAAGTAGDFFANLFNFDNGAFVGIDLRYGIAPGLLVDVKRTSDRTIDLTGQAELMRQTATRAVTIDVLGGAEAGKNFTRRYSPEAGLIVSRRFGNHGAAYIEPIGVFDANIGNIPATPDVASHDHTFLLGLGTRLRLGASRTYVVAEYAPRLAGYRPGVDHMSFGLEERVGGHMFQINISNSVGSTLAQLARGGSTNSNWYLGFNVSRRMF